MHQVSGLLKSLSSLYSSSKQWVENEQQRIVKELWNSLGCCLFPAKYSPVSVSVPLQQQLGCQAARKLTKRWDSSLLFTPRMSAAKEEWGVWPYCLACLLWAGCRYRPPITFLHTEPQSSSVNVVNESLEADVFSQLAQWERQYQEVFISVLGLHSIFCTNFCWCWRHAHQEN